MKRIRNHGIKSSSRKKRGSTPSGPFSMNWSEHIDSPTIPPSMGLVDAHDVIPLRNDRMGIVDGKLAIMEFQGVGDQNFTHSGWRGAVYRDTKTLSDNVYGMGVPLLHLNHASEHWAIAAWYNPIGYLELGVIGRDQPDFAYLDATWIAPASDWSDARIRSKGGYASVEVNGALWCGPVAIPEGLVGSTKHGAQLDYSNELLHEGVGLGIDTYIGFDDSPLGDRPSATIVSVGTAVNTASSTTINVPYPSSFQAGDVLVTIVATKNAGNISASGWTYRSATFGTASGIGVRIISKIATGSESGSLTVTKSTSGVMAGVMYATRNVSTTQAFFANGTGNSSASTSAASIAVQVLGIKRSALWICAADADTTITLPSGWSASSTGASGQAIKLTIGKVDDVETASFMKPLPYNAYDTEHMPIQTGTLGASTTSATGVILFNPTVGPL